MLCNDTLHLQNDKKNTLNAPTAKMLGQTEKDKKKATKPTLMDAFSAFNELQSFQVPLLNKAQKAKLMEIE